MTKILNNDEKRKIYINLGGITGQTYLLKQQLKKMLEHITWQREYIREIDQATYDKIPLFYETVILGVIKEFENEIYKITKELDYKEEN